MSKRKEKVMKVGFGVQGNDGREEYELKTFS
jgi:hypothetical protein